MKPRGGDYHLVVAHNFLSNISLDGSHEDTKLRMFNRPLCDSKVPKAPIADDEVSISIECADEDEVPFLEATAASMSTAARSCSPSSSFLTGSTTRKSKSTKKFVVDKLSVLQRFVRMVSNDDILAGQRQRSIPNEKMLTVCSVDDAVLKRKSVASERSADERPISPVSVTQFTFLRRLRTSLAKYDRSRSYLCTSSGAPVVVISHFPFQSSARDRSRLRRSRSSITSTERLNPNATVESVEELRPYDFKDVEYVHFEQLGSKLRRSVVSLGGVAWKSPSREERRTSEHQSSVLHSPPPVASLIARNSIESRGAEGAGDEESCQLDVDSSGRNDYDPLMLEEIASASRTIIRCNGFIGVTKLFAPAQVAKANLNETFAEKFPHIHLTYSKLRSIKRDIWQLAKECDVDEYTVAHSFVYFERVVVKGMISKHNRKLVAGVAFLVAVKLNDYKKPVIVKVLERAEEILRISRREMLSFELPLCSALQFDLFPPPHHVEPHLRKILFSVL